MSQISAILSQTPQSVNFKSKTDVQKIDSVKQENVNTDLLKEDAPNDVFVRESVEDEPSLTKEEKQQIIQQARQKASGWACFGGTISVLYYGLRSDKKVAEKFDLDLEKDKDLIKKIKKEQFLWTLPACIPGLGMLPGIVSYIYNRNLDPSEINV